VQNLESFTFASAYLYFYKEFNMMTRLFCILILAAMLPACVVSKKKYEQTEAQRLHTANLLKESQQENQQLKSDLAAKTTAFDSLMDVAQALKTENATQNEEIRRLKNQISTLREQNSTLSDEHARMVQNFQQLKNQSSREVRELINKLELLETDLAARERRLNEIESELAKQDSIMQAIRKTIEDALFGFKDAGLSVELRNGKVYVSLSNKLMFSSGSTQIDNRGKGALKELAKVLNDQTDLSILVEGHTDNVPVTNLGQIKDNWDLSVLRSTEVVRYLTEKEKVDPSRIMASGKGQHHPIADNTSVEDRAKNRRTEIILTPKLGEVYQMLQNKAE
jgi:chemotaxis protein MotB